MLPLDAVDRAKILRELRETFTAQLAHSSYIPFCKLAGSIHIEQHLSNDDLLRGLCAQYDQTITSLPVLGSVAAHLQSRLGKWEGE